MIDFRVKLLYPDAQAPVKAHDDDACYDVFAHSFWVWNSMYHNLQSLPGNNLNMCPGQRYLIKTGIEAAVPPGYEVQVRPRSGNALKSGVVVINSPGTIDAGYRNEYGVLLMTVGSGFTINKGDRIAQLAVRVVPATQVVVVDDLDETDRDKGGFGSSGK